MQTANSVATMLIATAVLCGAVRAEAEVVHCTPIASVPTVITTPGVYCFTKSLVTSMAFGIAIDVRANNVVIDMNGFRLGGLAAGFGTNAVGIYSTVHQNIVIRNGTIRGFWLGIALEDSDGSLVEDIRADQNTDTGIFVTGFWNIIRNNQVVATGGTTLQPNASGHGIYTDGPGVRVLNNDVISVTAVGSGTSFGIQVEGTEGLVVNNRITNADAGVVYGASATGKYRDNQTSNVVTPYSGGTDAGNNN